MKEFGILKPKQEGEFLFSMSNFISIIKRLLGTFEFKAFCEIGIEGKIMTQMIIDIAAPTMSKVYGIDPTVFNKPDYLNYILLTESSFTGLDKIDSCDVYFIDGDHNYYTVLYELNRIEKIAASVDFLPLIFIHDVGWPNDRRDAYYLPTFIPNEYVHDYNMDAGVNPVSDDLTEEGIASGNHNYVWRNIRGGEKNGVLTAVEDFIENNPFWDYVLIPGIFGLAVLYKKNCPIDFLNIVNELGKSVDWIYEICSILEFNRLELFCTNSKLDKELIQAQYELSQTQNELSQILNSRIWKWGNKVSKILQLIAPKSSLLRKVAQFLLFKK